ncbi:hypothetical protein [Paenibacillus vietnamensis]|nr:hypothetical protein [Paenibacillus vietnamensis]
MSENNNNRTLRLLFPRWQGGSGSLPLIDDINKTDGPKFNRL